MTDIGGKDGRARAFLGLGSNLEDREGNLERAAGLLAATPGIEVTAASSVYGTRPVGVTDQPDFLNQVLEVRTSLSPHALLRRCLAVEEEMGRVRLRRWGPRLIDIDLLLYGEEVVEDEELTLPHPEMAGRAFVLVPLLELDPGSTLPDGRRLADCLEALGEPDKVGVMRYE
jgi:2-amino-4-hydroxy-6-hydroxymethyldihydropteridine diphosphokinase